MTNEQAALEAQKRFGKYAQVYFWSQPEEEGMVYSVYPDQRAILFGKGRNWEEAFEDAEKKLKESK